MTNTFLKYLFFFSLLFSFQNIYTQNYTLSNWTVENGLSSNDVKEIIQDKDGFIWVATGHGLNKFDGYAFEKFRYNPSDSTSMGANYMNNMCQDSKGNIWINLGVGILSKYNRVTKNFKNYFFEGDKTYIFDLKYLEEFGLLIGTNKGLYKIDEKTDELEKIPLKMENDSPKVFKIFPVSNQKIYLTTNSGFKHLHLSSGFKPSKRFPLENPHDINSTFYVESKDTIDLTFGIEQLYEDSKRRLWAQTFGGSLAYSDDGVYFKKSYVDNHSTQTIPTGQLFISETKNTTQLFTKSYQLLIKSDSSENWQLFPETPENVPLAFLDNDPNLWICTHDNELLKWNGNDWEFIISLEDKLNHWEIKDVFVDAQNGIWFGSNSKGIWRIYNRKWPIGNIKNSLTNEPINFEIGALAITNPDFMWIGTYGNLFRFYFETGKLRPFFPNLNSKNPLSNLRINDIDQHKDGTICLATSHGFVLMNADGSDFQHLNYAKINDFEGPLNYTRNVLFDKSGKVWIGTTKGLFLFDKSANTFSLYGNNQSGKNHLRGTDIQSLIAVNDTSFLVGYTKHGADLVTFNPTDYAVSYKEIIYQNSKMEQSPYATMNTFYRTNSEFWAGSFSKGLLKIDLENLTMRPLSEDLPIIPNVRGIQKDSAGNLWVSSIDGLRNMHPETHKFYRFSKASGLLSNEFHTNCAVQDPFGNMYFGSKNGLNKIEPSKWSEQDTISTPILTAFKKYDKDLIFDKDVNEVETIPLSHEDDFITFEFVSPTFDNSRDVQYAYQLEAFDERWRYCKTERSATYTNLSAGEYIFKVRAGNKGGFFNSKTKTLQLIVSPPFWETSWFILLMIGLTILAFWAVYRIQWQLKMNRLKTIAEIRQKAADDFHDELGHRLTKIGLFVESLMLQKDNFPEKSAHTLQKIQDNANELYHSTKDFIWAINPSKDSAIELFILLRDFGDELFEDTNIQFSVEGLKEEHKDFLLDMDLKRQLVLIFKEAMNNALKHSNCSKVVFKIIECEQQIKLSLSDDGDGFVMKKEQFGYGLGSMFNRSKKVGGKLEVKTEVGKGTEILFIL